MQKVFFEIMKQFQGEYMGSMLSCFFESTGSSVRPDSGEDFLLQGKPSWIHWSCAASSRKWSTP